MAYGSIVNFRGLTFPWYFANKVNDGSRTINVKKIHYPGTNGIQALNMGTGEARRVHTGTMRKSTQASLNGFIGKIYSVCDGATGQLIYQGITETDVYCESVEYGLQYKADGNGGISASTRSHYARDFTITYVNKDN
jgi:hypothetical protein